MLARELTVATLLVARLGLPTTVCTSPIIQSHVPTDIAEAVAKACLAVLTAVGVSRIGVAGDCIRSRGFILKIAGSLLRQERDSEEKNDQLRDHDARFDPKLGSQVQVAQEPVLGNGR